MKLLIPSHIINIYDEQIGLFSAYASQVIYFCKYFVDLPEISTDGEEGYRAVFDGGDQGENETDIQLRLSILAESTSILLASNKQWEGEPGYVIQVDAAQGKQLRILKCTILEENCLNIYQKVSVFFQLFILIL
jgi:hypothetical protein